MFSIANNVRDENGESVIPASQRPDGTWRKARRVKEGYVPQEEVPLYESKGKQMQQRQHTTVVTVTPLPQGTVAHRTIPGLYIQEPIDHILAAKKKKKPKPDNVSDITQQVKAMKIGSKPVKPAKPIQEPKFVEPLVATDPAKKMKNLRKRLREIEILEEKLKTGQAKPDADQLVKLKRKPDLMQEIYMLEKSM